MSQAVPRSAAAGTVIDGIMTASTTRTTHVLTRVWDLPTRISHWLIVVLFGFQWWSAENDQLEWHILAGLGMLAVVIFRIYWGVVGSRPSRFTTFVRGPREVLRYAARLAERDTPHAPGHNPMGALSVVGLLSALLIQSGLGLFAIDVEGLNSGPLGYLVSFDRGRIIAGWHEVVFNLLMLLASLHLAAIAYYRFYRREDLVRPMVTGDKLLSGDTDPRDTWQRSIVWAIPDLVAGLIVAAIQYGRF